MKQSLVNLSYFLREIASRIVVAESSDGLQLPLKKRTTVGKKSYIFFHVSSIHNFGMKIQMFFDIIFF